MKLLTKLSLGLAAVTVALAAPTGNSSELIQPTAKVDDEQTTATITLDPETLPTLVPPGNQAGPQDEIGYRPFRMIVTEYCEASEGHPLVAKGTFLSDNNAYTHYFGQNKAAALNLGYPGAYLIYGPYNYWNRKIMQFRYGDCVWGEKGYKECGYCEESQAWTPEGRMNCAAGNQEPRTHKLDCMVAVERRGTAQADPKQIAALELETVAARDRSQVEFDEWNVAVSKWLANTVETSFIVPFHFQTNEYCDHGILKVKGVYNNGGRAEMDLAPGVVRGIDHGRPGFPFFTVSPYDYSQSKVSFGYDNNPFKCTWSDDETWKQCGECRAALWSSGPLDCASGGSRTKEMDCSFILVNKTTRAKA